MARLNVELKARDPDPEATAARCAALGAVDQGVLVQRDTYFLARNGRLKLRELDGGDSELIAYDRPDGAEATESMYVLAPVSAPAELTEALSAALGDAIVVVSKRRRLLLWEGVRIHLDEVEGLGTFIEFEAVEDPDGVSKLATLSSDLGIADDALIAVGYADLLMDGPEMLRRAAETAMRNAYAPYSNFKVGAAIRAASGAIYAAANVENVAFPQGQCAEASAIGAMVTAGETRITAVAVVAERLDECPPCGGCRQRLAEFGAPETPVHLGNRTVTLGELLPLSFDKGSL